MLLLGSTIGNYTADQATALLQRLSGQMEAGDYFLLGADLIKEPELIESAYNDRGGVTARFNRNILNVVNQMVSGNFAPESFAHVAFYDQGRRRIEMHLRATSKQHVELPGLHLSLEIQEGETIRTEISCKYDRASIEQLLGASGFEPSRWFTDPQQMFMLVLARKS